MATVFTKTLQPLDGSWTITVGIASKDPDDVELAQKYGDLDIEFGGTYTDPDDNTFSFTVPLNTKYTDVLLNKLPNVVFTYSFDDATIPSVTRYRQAAIMLSSMEDQITAAFTTLREKPTIEPINTTFTV